MIDHAAALVAELRASLAELRAPEDNSPPPSLPVGALSTKHAAALLGVTPYTLNEWARLGRIRCRQDSPGGRRYFYPADLAAYEAEHLGTAFADGIGQRYSPADETQRSPRPSAQARALPIAIGGGPPCHSKHGRAVGTRRAHRRPAGRGRPFAPGSHAWRPDPKKPPER